MSSNPSFSSGLSELRRILHNIADHTRVLQQVFAGGALGSAFRDRLMAHIRHEEGENQRALLALQEQPDLPAQAIRILIQHSQMLEALTEDAESDPAFVAGILHHFDEEHDWYEQALAQLAEASETPVGAAADMPAAAPTEASMTPPGEALPEPSKDAPAMAPAHRRLPSPLTVGSLLE